MESQVPYLLKGRNDPSRNVRILQGTAAEQEVGAIAAVVRTASFLNTALAILEKGERLPAAMLERVEIEWGEEHCDRHRRHY